MEQLNQLKRTIVADGRLSNDDVNLLRTSLLGGEGITREKACFLFDFKDMLRKEHVSSEFKDMFVEVFIKYLLEDEESPGEIDETEAKWLRAKMQAKGYLDNVDEMLLNNLRMRSINYPEILNFKGKMVLRFEYFLFYSRFLSIFAVIGSMLSACALFICGTWKVVHGLIDFVKSTEGTSETHDTLIETLVSSVDTYLFAMVMVIFGLGVYELFINKIDPVEKSADRRPSWLQISSIDDLKSSLGKVILMVLVVLFFKHSLDIDYQSTKDLVMLAAGILLLSASLFLANYHHKGKHK